MLNSYQHLSGVQSSQIAILKSTGFSQKDIAKMIMVSALTICVACYFAIPYHSWERRLNEHTNGLVKQYLPKSTNLALVSPKKIKIIENLLNNRPRKVLNYKKPIEVLLKAMRLTERITLKVEWALPVHVAYTSVIDYKDLNKVYL